MVMPHLAKLKKREINLFDDSYQKVWLTLLPEPMLELIAYQSFQQIKLPEYGCYELFLSGKAGSDVMSNNRTQLIATLEQTPSTLVELTSSLSEAELDFRPEADDWSIREILAHLVDDEMFVMRTRLERMVKEEQPTLASHDEKKWYRQRNTSRDALFLLLEDFELQRAASLGILRLFRDEEWLRTGYQPEYGHFTVEEWVGKWVEHDVVHLQQIEQNSGAYRRK